MGGKRKSRVEAWAERVRENIVGCQGCQPIEQEEGVVWMDGECTSIEDVLDWTVPDKYKDAVLAHVRCACGNSISRYDDVAVPFAFEIEHQRRLERARKRYATELDDFARWLERYPFLGAHHTVGRALLRMIARFPKAVVEGQLWYRARRIDGGRVFTAEDVRVPDPEQVAVSEGRYNHAGQAHWYLAGSEDTAMSEVLRDGERKAWVQRWKVGRLEGVLDLMTWGPDEMNGNTEPEDVDALPDIAIAVIFGRYLNQNADKSKGWKPESFRASRTLD